MADEIYSIINDFPSTFVSSICLHEEILSSAIVANLNGIIIELDVVTISFFDSVSPSDKTILDNIVTTHDNNCLSAQLINEESDADTDLQIEQDDSLVIPGTTILNFEGDVNVIDEGGGKATITVLNGDFFGNNYNYIESESSLSTTITSFTLKVGFLNLNLPTGDYRIQFTSETNVPSGTHNSIIVLEIDGVEHNINTGSQTGNNEWEIVNSFKKIALSDTSTHDIKILIASSSSGKEVMIRRARLELWRIA